MLDQSPDQLRESPRQEAGAGGVLQALGRRRSSCPSQTTLSTATSPAAASSTGPTRAAPWPRLTAWSARVARRWWWARCCPGDRLARLLADAWMLFPTESQYRALVCRGRASRRSPRGDWGPHGHGDSARPAYAMAIAGRATQEGPPPPAPPPARGASGRTMDRPAAASLRRRCAGRRSSCRSALFLNLRARRRRERS